MVEDGLEPEISEGHGTIAMELLANGAMYDAVVVPLGNGALLNGIARWFKAASPATRLIGVCATNAPSMEMSWRSGKITTTASADTIADGIAIREPIPEAVTDMQGIVDDVLFVDDAKIESAMRLAYEHAGLLLEPAGAVSLAAILATAQTHRTSFVGQRVAAILCGSNFSPNQTEVFFK
jgi:threonine dehydratase